MADVVEAGRLLTFNRRIGRNDNVNVKRKNRRSRNGCGRNCFGNGKVINININVGIDVRIPTVRRTIDVMVIFGRLFTFGVVSSEDADGVDDAVMVSLHRFDFDTFAVKCVRRGRAVVMKAVRDERGTRVELGGCAVMNRHNGCICFVLVFYSLFSFFDFDNAEYVPSVDDCVQ